MPPNNQIQDLQISISATFCDDIREEVGGKFTHVGIYSSDLIFSEFPAFLPKLGVSIKCSFPIAFEAKNVKFIIEKNDETLLESKATLDFKQVFSVRPEGQDASTRKALSFNMILPPMQFLAPCTLRAICEIDGLRYDAGKLHISSQEWLKTWANSKDQSQLPS